jgi:short-subunit dehydrogenase
MALPAPLPGRPVVVTGASAGIGAALAGVLAGRGHDLVLIARRQGPLDALAERVTADHRVDVSVLTVDLAVAGEREALADRLAALEPAGLCNNAGVAHIGPFLETERDRLRAIVEVNVATLQELTAAVLPGMVERGDGAVLQVASILGHGPQPHMAAYAATKAYAITLSEALHAELTGTGVSCTVVSPGPVRTGIYEDSGAPGLAGAGPGVLWKDAEEVAQAAVAGMERGSRAVSPGLLDELAAAGSRYLPRTVRLPVQVAVGAAVPALRRLRS